MTRAAWLVLLVAVAACAPKHTPRALPSSVAATTQNRPPIVRARCEPCSVAMGKAAIVRVEAQDPDGDSLTYTWTAPAGAIASPSAAMTSWMAPAIEGPVFLAIRVTDGKGGLSSDVITITVTK